MISVIIPLYNKEAGIATALSSVLTQSYQDFEIVVVDDGSTDGSVAVVKTFNDPRIRLIQQQNAGVSAARNHGIAEAKGEYVSFLDADDEWEPGFLAEIRVLQEAYPDCRAQATNYSFCSNGVKSSTILRKIPFDGERGVLTNYFEVASCSNPPVCSICVCIERKLLEDIGGFPVGVKSGEDLLTWARIAVCTQWAYSRKAFSVFNIEGYEINERPKRIPAEIDIVGNELKSMHRNNPEIKGLKQYIALWHKMRCSIYMRLSMPRKSIGEALKGLKYQPLNHKLYAYILLNLIPETFRKKILKQ